MKNIVYTMVLCGLLFLGITRGYTDPYKLSPEYRPVKISIYWAGWDEEREHTLYEYNKKGQLVKTSIFRDGGTPSWYTTYEYTKENKLGKKSTYSGTELSGYSDYMYIDDRLYEIAERDSKGNYRQVEQYEYDVNGNIFSVGRRQAPYNGTTLAWDSLEIYFHTNDNKQISEKLNYYNGTLHNKSTYQYKTNNLVITTFWLGDLRDVSSQAIKTFTYNEKGNNRGKLKELIYNNTNFIDGKEYVECCNTYSMIPTYDPAGNMTILSYYNCEKELSGKAVIVWEKGKTSMKLIIEVFDHLHWYFTGC